MKSLIRALYISTMYGCLKLSDFFADDHVLYVQRHEHPIYMAGYPPLHTRYQIPDTRYQILNTKHQIPTLRKRQDLLSKTISQRPSDQYTPNSFNLSSDIPK